MAAELFEELSRLLQEARIRETPEILKLYKKFFYDALHENSVFAFIGPGLGSEVFAMILACQEKGILNFDIIQVDHPQSKADILVGLPPFTTLRADYIEETARVFSFLRANNVNAIIIRNTQTTPKHIPVLTAFAKYVTDINGNGLITVREKDFSPVLDENLLTLGMQRYERPPDLSVTEKYLYVR